MLLGLMEDLADHGCRQRVQVPSVIFLDKVKFLFVCVKINYTEMLVYYFS